MGRVSGTDTTTGVGFIMGAAFLPAGLGGALGGGAEGASFILT